MERTWFEHLVSVSSMISNRLKNTKPEQLMEDGGGGGGSTVKKHWSHLLVFKYGGIIGFIYLPFVVSNSYRVFLNCTTRKDKTRKIIFKKEKSIYYSKS